MRIIKLTLALVLAAVSTAPLALAAESTSVRAILITATNQKQEADPKLAAFEAELQRNLPLSSFRYVGEGSASVAGNGRASITLGRSHRVELESVSKGADGIAVKVQWTNGGTVVLATGLTLSPGIPAVLGRRPSGDGDTPIVLLIAK